MNAWTAFKAYKYFRAALSSLIGFGILLAGILNGRSGDLAWYLLLFLFAQGMAYLVVRRVRQAEEEAHFEDRIARRREELDAKAARQGPVTGKRCAHCDERIVIADDGLRCEACSEPIHDDCAKAHRAKSHQNKTGTYR